MSRFQIWGSHTSAGEKRAGSSLRFALLILAFFLVNLVLLMLFADRDGYEGDDLNSIVPMFHLDEAKHGLLLIYRYAWQPLSYEIGAALLAIAGSPTVVFLLAPIAAALSITLLLLLTWRDRTSSSSLVASVVALMAVPELWFSGLYYNSTIIGLPFAVASLLVLRTQPGSALGLFAGMLAGTAVLIRLDFALALPALALAAWQRDRSLAQPAVFVSGAVIVLLLALVGGLLDPAAALEVMRSSSAEIVQKAHDPGWDRRTKLFVLSVLLSPVGWALLLVGGPIVVYRRLADDPKLTLLWVLAIAPLALPLPDLLSVKYALPLLMLLPAFFVLCLDAVAATIPAGIRQWPLRVGAAATVFLLVFSFSVMGHAPFLQVGTIASRQIGTHDGYRSYGGYLWEAALVDRLEERSEAERAAACIQRNFLGATRPDIVIAGGENYFDRGGIGWRHLQLSLERAGVHGRLIGPHQIQFESHGRRLTLVHDLVPGTLAELQHGRGLHIYDLRDSSARTEISCEANPAE